MFSLTAFICHRLQAFICRAQIEDFAMVSDTAYVAQVSVTALSLPVALVYQYCQLSSIV